MKESSKLADKLVYTQRAAKLDSSLVKSILLKNKGDNSEIVCQTTIEYRGLTGLRKANDIQNLAGEKEI